MGIFYDLAYLIVFYVFYSIEQLSVARLGLVCILLECIIGKY